MKLAGVVIAGLVILGIGIVYSFPNVVGLTDHCLDCGLGRSYLMMSDAQHGGHIYNLNLEHLEGRPILNHPHIFCDPQSDRERRMPRWTLLDNGLQ